MASTVFVKFFYVSFVFGIFFFVLALILFIVPVKSEFKVQEDELEEAISVWSYQRRSEPFKDSVFTLKFDTTSFQADNPVL